MPIVRYLVKCDCGWSFMADSNQQALYVKVIHSTNTIRGHHPYICVQQPEN